MTEGSPRTPRAGEPPELSEDVDLDMERRRYILDAHGQLARIHHYALLGVSRTADKKAVKDAYFRLAGLVHPDSYFGKRLGSFKPKMELLFARITQAYETLSSDETRAAYDAQLEQMEAHDKEVGRHAVVAPVDPRVAAKREAAVVALKAHFAEGKAKAKQYAEAGARARFTGDLVAATDAYRRALTFAPGDPELVAAVAELEQASRARLAESHVRKAQIEERFGRWASAVESWRQVVAARPDDVEARARLAVAIAKAGGHQT